MNLNTHPGFTELTESERYWAGYLNRIAERNEWSKPEESAGQSFALLELGRRFEEKDRWDAWLVETLLSALIMQERDVAFNAMVQALRYDALAEANNRIRYPDALRAAADRLRQWTD